MNSIGECKNERQRKGGAERKGAVNGEKLWSKVTANAAP